jgi:micrococcal nuclease
MNSESNAPKTPGHGEWNAWPMSLRHGLSALLAICVLVIQGPFATAKAAPCEASHLDLGKRIVVEAIAADGTLIAIGDQEIRLAGITLPRPAFGHDPKEPLADLARHHLAELTVGRPVILYHGHERRDRYDRALAHPCLEDGTWIQKMMLKRGLAMVATTRDTATLALEMLAFEREARTQKVGIWAERFFRIRNPHETRRDIDTYQIVEGRVVSAVVIKGRAYLNFGPDWRTDFTFSISPRDRRRFEKTGIDLSALSSRRVRGRGWVTLRNGPLIELTHPEQLEVLPE